MGLNPFPAGDGRPWEHTFTTDSGIFPLTGLLGSDIAFHLQDVNTGVLYICTGVWSVTDAVGGKAKFTPSVADLLPTNPLGKPGLYRAYPVVALSSGPVPMDAQLLQVVSEP